LPKLWWTFESLAEEWTKTPRDFLIKLVHSMPKRCKAVIAAGGDHIHY